MYYIGYDMYINIKKTAEAVFSMAGGRKPPRRGKVLGARASAHFSWRTGAGLLAMRNGPHRKGLQAKDRQVVADSPKMGTGTYFSAPRCVKCVRHLGKK